MIYDTPSWLTAFSLGKGVHGTEPGTDARETGLQGEGIRIDAAHIMIPRQTHSTNVCYVDFAGEVPDTDAVITDKAGLCIAVKTADCIPVLLYDSCRHLYRCRAGPGMCLPLSGRAYRWKASRSAMRCMNSSCRPAFPWGDWQKDSPRPTGSGGIST